MPAPGILFIYSHANKLIRPPKLNQSPGKHKSQHPFFHPRLRFEGKSNLQHAISCKKKEFVHRKQQQQQQTGQPFWEFSRRTGKLHVVFQHQENEWKAGELCAQSGLSGAMKIYTNSKKVTTFCFYWPLKRLSDLADSSAPFRIARRSRVICTLSSSASFSIAPDYPFPLCIWESWQRGVLGGR